MAGNKVEVPVKPTKYADGWCAHNEITIMLSGAEGLVATHCAQKDYQWMYKVCPNMSKATATFGNDFNFEDLAALEPQVIFDSTDDLRDKAAEVDQILNDPNWASINAVKNGKVYVNPKSVFGWDRYGVEELLQIQWAAATLHPELFSDLDINSKVKDFYKTYLNYNLTDSDVELILAAKNPA